MMTIATENKFACAECGQLVWQEGHSTAPLCPICHHLSECSSMSPADQDELRNYLGRPLKNTITGATSCDKQYKK
jgi:hypothetical protein